MKLYWLALLLILVAALLYGFSKAVRKKSGLPGGQIVYSDTDQWQKNEQAFFDPRLNLTGKPDYVIRQGNTLIPVEVKSGRTPQEPYDSHIFQLAAYCHLIDQASGLRPPYGLLHYPKQTFKIEFTEALESAFLALVADLHEKERRNTALQRSHNEMARCRHCGFRNVCEQRLEQ